jgi:DNA polymerase
MDMLEALRLQIAWGADEALEEAPLDRLATPAPAAPPPASALVPASPVARAQAAAAAAATVEGLRAALSAFTECPLAITATNLVFADGDPEARVVLVGDVPGAEEDKEGRPFAGPAGQLLDRMLASIGLSRADVLMTNAIPWRPPGNRPPTDGEVQMCLPFLLRHLALVRPRVVVSLGQLPSRALTGSGETIRKLRGRWHTTAIDGLNAPVPVLPMLHPTYILTTPAAKRDAWTDLIVLKRRLDGL